MKQFFMDSAANNNYLLLCFFVFILLLGYGCDRKTDLGLTSDTDTGDSDDTAETSEKPTDTSEDAGEDSGPFTTRDGSVEKSSDSGVSYE